MAVKKKENKAQRFHGCHLRETETTEINITKQVFLSGLDAVAAMQTCDMRPEKVILVAGKYWRISN